VTPPLIYLYFTIFQSKVKIKRRQKASEKYLSVVDSQLSIMKVGENARRFCNVTFASVDKGKEVSRKWFISGHCIFCTVFLQKR